MRLVARKAEERERKKEKLCQHVDSSGHQCTMKKMQKKGAAYCYKHRPKAKSKERDPRRRKSKGDKKAKRTYNRYRKGGRKGQR